MPVQSRTLLTTANKEAFFLKIVVPKFNPKTFFAQVHVLFRLVYLLSKNKAGGVGGRKRKKKSSG